MDPNCSCFKNDASRCPLQDLQKSFPSSVPEHNSVSEHYGQFLLPHNTSFPPDVLSAVRLYIDRAVTFQIMSS